MSVIQGDVGGVGGTDATITFSDITTNNASTTKHGFLPKGPGTGKFLKDDISWAAIAGGGDMLAANNLSDVVSTASARTNLGLAIGTNVQAQDAELSALAGLTSAADKLPYFTGAGTAATADFTAAGRALVDDANAAAQRTTLGLAIGTNVQAWDADLDAIAGLTSAADKLPYFTGLGTAATTDFTSAGRALVDDADASAQRTTLGLGTLATQSGTFSGTSSGTNTGDQTLSDATISTTDITTNNFTTAKHGFVPKGTNVGSFLKDDGTWAAIPGGGDALTSNPLSQFAATTSLQLKNTISDETGSGALVFGTSPTLTTPDIGVAAATTVNKITITSPATGATLTIVDGKTLTASNNATVSGTNTGDQTITGRLVGLPQVLTTGTAATYTPTAGTASIVVEGWAEGGGGGGVAATSASQASIACGGGSGGYFCHRYASITTGTYTVSNVGGAKGNNAGAASGDGADTTFTDGSTLLTAKGGKGAQAGVATGTSTTVLAGALGGAISTNGNIRNIGGAGGGMSIRTGTGGANSSISGYGGGPNGGDARGTSGAGIDAKGPGGGGGGALGLSSGAAAAGGQGGPGLIIVWEYSS